MTLYTIVSIVIALCGSTFTAIIQFSAFWGERVRLIRTKSSEALKSISSKLSDKGTQKAKARRRDNTIALCFFLWRIAGLPPVLILLIFAFTITYSTMGDINSRQTPAITDDAVSFYSLWLHFVFWANVGSLILKLLTGIALEFFAYMQSQCMQTAAETVSEAITLDTGSGIPPPEN